MTIPLLALRPRYRHRLILLYLLLWCLPFLCIRDIYPLFRYGMFAEPVRYAVQQEQFWIQMQDSSGRWRDFDAPQAGMNASIFAYIQRQYFYQHGADTLLARLHAVTAGRYTAWRLVHAQEDRVQVRTWTPPTP